MIKHFTEANGRYLAKKVTDLLSAKVNIEDACTREYVDSAIAAIKRDDKSNEPPILFIDGGTDLDNLITRTDVPAKKVKIKGRLHYVVNGKEFVYYVIIKLQGTSSLAYPKKNFTITFYTDDTYEFKLDIVLDEKWGGQNKYCFKANYIDHSHMRNIISARLWSQMVDTRADVNEELLASPNNGAIDGFPVRVYVNSRYTGLYTINIPKDGWMTNMYSDNELQGILCGENYQSGLFRELPLIDGSDWSEELRDTATDTELQSWRNAIQFVMNNDGDDFKNGLSTYFDIPSLIDYYIHAYVTNGLDSMGKNQIYLTYDMVKWIASMYDMDSTWGLYWNGQSFVEATYRMQEDYESGKNGGNLLFEKLKTLFNNEIYSRYLELRNSVLSYSNIMRQFETFNDECKMYYQDDIDAGYQIPQYLTNNIKQLRTFVLNRLNYVDSMISQIDDVMIDTISIEPKSKMYTNTEYTMKPSITPITANKYNLVWSIDGVGSLDGNKYTSNEVGEVTFTVLDTVTNKSATYTTEIYEQSTDENILYQANNLIFDGTSLVDTGVNMFSSNNPYCKMELTFSNSANGQSDESATVFNDMDETLNQGYPGVTFKRNPSNNSLFLTCYDTKRNNMLSLTNTTIHTITLTRLNETIAIIFDDLEVYNNTPTNFKEFENNATLSLGGLINNTTGENSRFWKGTIHNVVVTKFGRPDVATDIAIAEDHTYINIPRAIEMDIHPNNANTDFTYSVLSGNATFEDGILTALDEQPIEISVFDRISGITTTKTITVQNVPLKVEYDLSVIQTGEKWGIDTSSHPIDFENETLSVTYKNNNVQSLGNVISVGMDIAKWKTETIPNGVNIHCYQPIALNTNPNTEIDIVHVDENRQGGSPLRIRTNNNNNNNNNNNFMFNKNGIYFDGEVILNSDGVNTKAASIIDNKENLTFADAQRLVGYEGVQIGSKEGENRSSATYNSICVYNAILTKSDVKSLYEYEHRQILNNL